MIARQPCSARFAHTPVLLPRRRANELAECGRREWGGGRRVIRAITRQGSATVNHICPSRLCGDRRGGDPDLPPSTDSVVTESVCCSWYWVTQACRAMTHSRSSFPLTNNFMAQRWECCCYRWPVMGWVVTKDGDVCRYVRISQTSSTPLHELQPNFVPKCPIFFFLFIHYSAVTLVFREPHSAHTSGKVTFICVCYESLSSLLLTEHYLIILFLSHVYM